MRGLGAWRAVALLAFALANFVAVPLVVWGYLAGVLSARNLSLLALNVGAGVFALAVRRTIRLR